MNRLSVPNNRIEPMTSRPVRPLLQAGAIGALLVTAHPQRWAHSYHPQQTKGTSMKTMIQSLRLGLAALLLAATVQSVPAAPPRTGIRGQTLIYQPGFAVEVSPGVWIGDGGFSFGWPASFRVFPAHSRRQIAHVTSGSDGSFEVSLPPGRYVVIPDPLPWYAPTTTSLEVTVRPRHFTDVFIYYQSVPITVTP
jgi:hypothetical protein